MAFITTYDQALDSAYKWAKSQPPTLNKTNARVYIDAISMAEEEGIRFYGSYAKGRAMQLAYILGNLRGWRGQEARASKVILKEQYDKDK